MILQTKEKLAKSAPARWSSRYENYGSDDKDEITQRLNALGHRELTADMVDQIIGNTSWTRLECDCCGALVEQAVCATEIHGDKSLLICSDCISDASQIIHS